MGFAACTLTPVLSLRSYLLPYISVISPPPTPIESENFIVNNQTSMRTRQVDGCCAQKNYKISGDMTTPDSFQKVLEGGYSSGGEERSALRTYA